MNTFWGVFAFLVLVTTSPFVILWTAYIVSNKFGGKWAILVLVFWVLMLFAGLSYVVTRH